MSRPPYRKLQVFISSTYVDLRAERQSAVTAILETGHIPAGMELFAAGDEEQLTVIRRWIDRSDIFLLILGRRYGSIDPKSGSSYIHLEYEYARQTSKPFFALLLSDAFVDEKIRAGETIGDVTEGAHPEQFRSFENEVKSRMCKFVHDHKDIRLAVSQSIRELDDRYELVGWISPREIDTAASSVPEPSNVSTASPPGGLQPPFKEAEVVREARQRASRLATSDLSILIMGEPGTGRRTLAANLARERAARKSCPLLFLDGVTGFTDGTRRSLNSGTAEAKELLVHHLEALPKLQQLELASLIHSKRVRVTAVVRLEQIDSDTEAEVDAIFAPELDAELRSSTVKLPALRERDSDSVQWATLLSRRAAVRLDVPAPSFSPRAIGAITSYRWPGNLIELEAVISRALCFSSSPNLEPNDLGLSESETAIQPLAKAVEQFQSSYVERALAHFSGNRTQAARALRVDPRTVFRYLEKQRR